MKGTGRREETKTVDTGRRERENGNLRWLSEWGYMLTGEIYGRISFFLLSLCGYFFVISFLGDRLRPVYLKEVDFYLDRGGLWLLGWILFFLNFWLLLQAGYGKRSLVNLFQVSFFPYWICLGLQGMEANPGVVLPFMAALFFAGAAGCLYIGLDTMKRRRKIKKKRARRKLMVRSLRRVRCVITALAVLFCAAVTGAGSRSAWQEELLDWRTKDVEAVWSEKNEDNLKLLEAEGFRRLEEAQQIEIMQAVADIEMIHFGIDRIELASEWMEDKNENGYYDGIRKRIVLNTGLFGAEADVERCMDTVLHECFHVYQRACVEAVDWKRADTSLLMYRDAARWRENFQEYITVEGDATREEFYNYYGQSVEADAREYASRRMDKYLLYLYP